MKNKSNNKYRKFSKNNFTEKLESNGLSKNKNKRSEDFKRNFGKSSNNKFVRNKNDNEYQSKNNYRKII